MEPWLERAAALRPNRTAVEAEDGTRTYAQLLERARGVAARLTHGERAAIALPSGVEFAEVLHGCLLAGAVAMPVDLRLAEREREVVLRSATTVVDESWASDAARAGDESWASDEARGDDERVVRQPHEHDVALVVHTSGTTGEPRPVELSFGNVLAQARGSAAALGHDPGERWLCPLPLSHVGGLMVLLRSAIHATTAILGPPDRPDITLASMVPTQLARLLDSPPPPSLRAVLLGGAAADRTLLDAGWPVAPTYGLSEACSSVTIGEVGDVATSGRAIPGVTVAIADDGEIIVDGPTVAGGGTLRTGDLGRLDDRGRLIVIGRKADTIVSGGENVAPAEVEAVLLEHPAVAEAVVFARPHPEWGEAVTARVVLRSHATEAELRAWVGDRLARFKVPKAIEIAEALPRTTSGKLLRRELA
jgi:o-succinylbenzoate---CoA ligase